jgi:hypothetical protein
MVILYRCDREASDELRNKQINDWRIEIASKLLAESKIDALTPVHIAINVRKIRNRSQTDTKDRYIISGSIIV